MPFIKILNQSDEVPLSNLFKSCYKELKRRAHCMNQNYYPSKCHLEFEEYEKCLRKNLKLFIQDDKSVDLYDKLFQKSTQKLFENEKLLKNTLTEQKGFFGYLMLHVNCMNLPMWWYDQEMQPKCIHWSHKYQLGLYKSRRDEIGAIKFENCFNNEFPKVGKFIRFDDLMQKMEKCEKINLKH